MFAVVGGCCFYGCATKVTLNDAEARAVSALKGSYGFVKYEMDEDGRLISLSLGSGPFKNSAIDQVGQFHLVESLSLSGPNVTDDDIVSITRLKRLARLELVSTSVSDRGLSRLEGMASLREIWLRSSARLTSRGIRSLKGAIPGVRVHDMSQNR